MIQIVHENVIMRENFLAINLIIRAQSDVHGSLTIVSSNYIHGLGKHFFTIDSTPTRHVIIKFNY